MTAAITRRVAPPGPTPGATARRLRFVEHAEAGARVRRTFRHPRSAVAIEETADPAGLLKDRACPEPTAHCDIVFVPRGAGGDVVKEAWLASAADRTEAEPPVVVERDGLTAHWRPGQALVQGTPERCDEVLPALADFAFYEGELRALEAVEAHEAQAREDVACAHRIRSRDRKHWARFGELIEYFSQLRLTYARLAPRLARASRTLSAEGRRLVTRLLSKADVKDRLEAVSERLEALEDLYEGANDRVADFRWYRNGHLLEIGILVCLLIEALLMVGDMYIHYREYQAEKAAAGEGKSADLSEEFQATITRVADDRVTFTREGGAEQSLPLADNVKVYKAKIDKETKEVDAGEAIPGGLKSDVFAKMGDKGVRVTLVTDAANKKVAEVYVMPPARKR